MTCYTCHRGDLKPENSSKPGSAIRVTRRRCERSGHRNIPGGPTVDQVFEKYTQALGGAQRLAALTSYSGKRHLHRIRDGTDESTDGDLCQGAVSTRDDRENGRRR